MKVLNKAEIIAKGKEHKSYHRVEIGEFVYILSYVPFVEQNVCCLLCVKQKSKEFIVIPAEWLKIVK